MDLRNLAFKVSFDGSTAAVREMDGATSRLGGKVDSTVKKLEGMSSSLGKVGKNMTKKLTVPIAGVAAASIKLGANFDDQMSTVQAVTGATATEMESLRSQARLMGKDTRYSASEAAQGQENLARAGFETSEIINALGDTLNLATAGALGLGEASEITASTIRGFGLQASDAGRVADVLAYTSSATKTNVDGLGQSFSMVAPVASALGLGIEEMAAATGILGDNAIEGSQAGNMLKRGLLNLSSPTKQQNDMIKELGMNFFDANGDMISMVGIIGELEKGLEGMTSQQQTATLSTIFGSEAVSGWTALVNTGSEALQGLQTELEGSTGYAEEFANTAEDNLAGSFRSLKSSTEELMLSFYEMGDGPIRSLVDKFTGLIDKVSELDDGTKQMIILAGGILAAAGPVLMIGSKVIGLIGSTISIGAKLVGGITTIVGVLGGPLTLAIGAAIAIGIALYKNWDTVKEKATQLKESISTRWNELKGATSEAWNSMKETVTGFIDTVREKWQGLKNFLKNPIKGTVNIVQNLWNKVTGKSDGSHRSGLDRVPFDGYVATLHKNEEVLRADDPRNQNNRNRGDYSYKGKTQRANDIVYNPVVNITVGEDVGEDTKKDLEKTIKEILDREREKFFYKMNLKTT